LNVGLNELFFADGQRYFLYVPASVLANPRESYILAAIHGFSGRTNDSAGVEIVRDNALRWSELAEKNRWIVLAPHFDEGRFNDDYQRLNFSLIGDRADLRLNDLILEVARQIPGINSDKIYLFGFSGGGQFVHRYAAFHPDRVLRAVAGGAGWYMWPDEDLLYPVGLSISELLFGIKPRINKLLNLDLLVLVGEDDTTKEELREVYFIYDLTNIQGGNRKIRAQNWINELEKISKKEGIEFNVKLAFAPNTGHSITSELKRIASDYLVPPHTDVNKDGTVNMLDVVLVGEKLGWAMSASANPNPDLNGDGAVSILDLIIVCQSFGAGL
jgi:pimeloyl-ACP methyl ester carboxylesterase